MTTRAYDSATESLPPLTRAISATYGVNHGPGQGFGGRSGRPFDPVFTTAAFSAMLDAIHALELHAIELEQRIIELETP